MFSLNTLLVSPFGITIIIYVLVKDADVPAHHLLHHCISISLTSSYEEFLVMSNLETGAKSVGQCRESEGWIAWTWQGCLLPCFLWGLWALPASPGLKV